MNYSDEAKELACAWLRAGLPLEAIAQQQIAICERAERLRDEVAGFLGYRARKLIQEEDDTLISVTVAINGTPVIYRAASRSEDFKGKESVHSYLTRDGKTIEHKYSDGAAALAIKLLQCGGGELYAARICTNH